MQGHKNIQDVNLTYHEFFALCENEVVSRVNTRTHVNMYDGFSKTYRNRYDIYGRQKNMHCELVVAKRGVVSAIIGRFEKKTEDIFEKTGAIVLMDKAIESLHYSVFKLIGTRDSIEEAKKMVKKIELSKPFHESSIYLEYKNISNFRLPYSLIESAGLQVRRYIAVNEATKSKIMGIHGTESQIRRFIEKTGIEILSNEM